MPANFTCKLLTNKRHFQTSVLDFVSQGRIRRETEIEGGAAGWERLLTLKIFGLGLKIRMV